LHRALERGAHVCRLGSAQVFCRERDAIGRGNADRRRAADHHVANRGRHRIGVAQRQINFLCGQAPLIEQFEAVAAPADRFDGRVHDRCRLRGNSGTRMVPYGR